MKLKLNDPVTGSLVREAMTKSNIESVPRGDGAYVREGDNLFWDPGDTDFECESRPWANAARWINMIPDEDEKREVMISFGFTFVTVDGKEEIVAESVFDKVNLDTPLDIRVALDEEIEAAKKTVEFQEPAQTNTVTPPPTDSEMYVK